MEYTVVVQNPCNTGNKVVFADEKRKTLGPFTLTSGCNNEKLVLPRIFIDQFSKTSTIGTCGNLVYSLGNQIITVEGEYNFIYFNEDNTHLIIKSDDVADEGSY